VNGWFLVLVLLLVLVFSRNFEHQNEDEDEDDGSIFSVVHLANPPASRRYTGNCVHERCTKVI